LTARQRARQQQVSARTVKCRNQGQKQLVQAAAIARQHRQHLLQMGQGSEVTGRTVERQLVGHVEETIVLSMNQLDNKPESERCMIRPGRDSSSSHKTSLEA
jgi:hypothetical protein